MRPFLKITFAFAIAFLFMTGTAAAQEVNQAEIQQRQPVGIDMEFEAPGAQSEIRQFGNRRGHLAFIGQTNPLAQAEIDQEGIRQRARVRQTLSLEGIIDGILEPSVAFPDEIFFPSEVFINAPARTTRVTGNEVAEIRQRGERQAADIAQLGGPHEATIRQSGAQNRAGLVQAGGVQDKPVTNNWHKATIEQSGQNNLVAGNDFEAGNPRRPYSDIGVAPDRRAGQFGDQPSELNIRQLGANNRFGVVQAGGIIAGVSRTSEGLAANSEGAATQQSGATATVVQSPDLPGPIRTPTDRFVGLFQDGPSTAHIRQDGASGGSTALVFQRGAHEALIHQSAPGATAEILQLP